MSVCWGRNAVNEMTISLEWENWAGSVQMKPRKPKCDVKKRLSESKCEAKTRAKY